jgi:hypothetical protein
MLINWGTTGRVTEVTPRDDVALGLQLQYYSYRAVRGPWGGSPAGRPAIAASRGRSVTRVWASWNGATDVARWRVLAGRSEDALRRKRASRRFAGLETLIRARTRARYVAVQALDEEGTVLGRSRAVRISRAAG